MGSKSRSTSSSQSSSRSFVDPQQQPFLQQLRQQATQVQQGQQQQRTATAFDIGGDLLSAGGQGLANVGAIQGDLRGQLQGSGAFRSSAQALRQQAFGENPELQNQIDLLGQDIGQTFSQQILPGIQSEAIGFGQLGGGREGVAQGLASQSALGEFQRGASFLRSEDINRQLAAATSLGQLGLGQQAQTGGQLEAAGQLNLGGIESLQSLFNLGLAPFDAEFGGLQQLAQIIGDPTILQTAQATGEAASKGFGLFNFFGPSGGSASSSGGGSGS
jgi:hypothetical protein